MIRMGLEIVLSAIMRRQYNQIKHCLYCSGYDLKCEIYSSESIIFGRNHQCSNIKVIMNDLNKFKIGVDNITYPILKPILKREKIKY